MRPNLALVALAPSLESDHRGRSGNVHRACGAGSAHHHPLTRNETTMTNRSNIFALATAAGFCLALVGCESGLQTSPTSAGSLAAPVTAAAARAPVGEPLLIEIDDVNACNGLPITLTYAGTALVQEFGDHSLLHVNGTVTTTDGFTGTFNWAFVFQDDQVAHISAHDMEVSDASGQRIIFAVGVEHTTSVDGTTVVSFVHFSHDRIRCIGSGAS
jgi:hypothetical protein